MEEPAPQSTPPQTPPNPATASWASRLSSSRHRGGVVGGGAPVVPQLRSARKVERQQERNLRLVVSLVVIIGMISAYLAATPELPFFMRSPPRLLSPAEVDALTLIWCAPFFSGGGYSSEAINFALALKDVVSLGIVQHGDSYSHSFVSGLPQDARETLEGLSRVEVDAEHTIMLCHSEPGAWTPAFYPTTPCPVDGPAYLIGRTMFETDRITRGWVERCNSIVDEVWVPTEFHRTAFMRSGVHEERLIVVPEPIDEAFWDPNLYTGNFDLKNRFVDKRIACWVGAEGGAEYKGEKCRLQGTVESAQQANENEEQKKGHPQVGRDACFSFLSVFKWEYRKGWDVLLRAFLAEFDARYDHVCLYIKTAHFHSTQAFTETISKFAAEQLNMTAEDWRARAPVIEVISSHVPQQQMPTLYKSVDCVVIPSRGEGWGRPHVEALAMEVPLIATYWSGPTAFMTQDNSFPLSIDGMERITEGPWRNHKWAKPSVEHLRKLMREIYSHPGAARKRAVRGREDIVSQFGMVPVAQLVASHMHRIKEKLKLRNHAMSVPFGSAFSAPPRPGGWVYDPTLADER